MTVTPYIDFATNLKKSLEIIPTTRTGAGLTSEFGAFTIITKRITDWNEIVTQLPCIVIDMDTQGIQYDPTDQGFFRLIPVVVVVYIPIMSRNKTEAEARVEEDKSDRVVKTAVSDLEEILVTSQNANVSYIISLLGAYIPYEAFDADESIGIKMRIGQIDLIAKSQIR